MKATILTIGDEILIGQITDTNTVSIARHLNQAGIVVVEKSSIGDERQMIVERVTRAMNETDLVIITGGLGPTKDDITKKTLAEMFHSQMVRNDEVAAHVEKMLTSRGIAYNALNQGQALVPECCEVLFNRNGTAPGMWFEQRGKIVISLPGVPYEMEHLMQEEVMPRLKQRFSLRQIVHRTMITAGLAESMLAEKIAAWEDALPEKLKLAYLPNPGAVRLRLSAYEVDGEKALEEIEARFAELEKIIPEYIIGFETASLEEQVHELLVKHHLTLSVAESCTGGRIASRFTAMAGASAYFRAGVVAYHEQAKNDILGVSLVMISQSGVVSEAVAKAMAEGVRRLAKSDYAISTTGIAGPTGGTEEQPVGTVWMAVATPYGVKAVLKQCGTDRGQVIERASSFAITLLRDAIREDLQR